MQLDWSTLVSTFISSVAISRNTAMIALGIQATTPGLLMSICPVEKSKTGKNGAAYVEI